MGTEGREETGFAACSSVLRLKYLLTKNSFRMILQIILKTEVRSKEIRYDSNPKVYKIKHSIKVMSYYI